MDLHKRTGSKRFPQLLVAWEAWKGEHVKITFKACNMIFAPISPQFYSLNKLMLVEESQSQSADYSWQITQKIA